MMKLPLTLTLLTGLLVLFANTESVGSTAPCSAKEYAQFDFWLGSWEVHSPKGVAQGTNEITKEEGNCLIVERWKSARGGTGQSYNYYNPADKSWHQLWVSQGAIIRYQGALSKSGAMQLHGHIFYQADGRTADFQGSWTPQADGSVLQEFKEKDARTGEWKNWFTGVYTRRATATP